jgi:HD-GYP domain-containing protein (c-di-GMP phosphodiesterase class II)
LAGESIPKIARILAVADAFSAMTTTRPYRKALDVREALVRLGDAAGTQLDEDLVIAFIEGIEHDADPPVPREAGSPTGDPTVLRRWVA